MATLEPGGNAAEIPHPPTVVLPRLRWLQILSISIFWFALNFHWAALGIIILPSQVFKLTGGVNNDTALAFVLIPGAFVSLFANPLFGMLSDHMRGWLAAFGRRRPFILVGTFMNIGGLVWMALAPNIPELAIAYVIVQFSNNAATAPFHALLPDIVPSEQRGLTSGIMGVLSISGTIGGVILAGQLINATQPLAEYQSHLWLVYTIIVAVLVALMLITILSVRERHEAALSGLQQLEDVPAPRHMPLSPRLPRWLTRSVLINVVGTGIMLLAAWGVMSGWNMLRLVQINGNMQQVVLEVIATIGILRLFDFHPRRDPDFAWVLATRLVMMLAIYTVQDFLQDFMRYAVHVKDAEVQTTNFVIVLSLSSLVSTLAVGWLSDRFGRKRMVYLSGSLMALVGLVFIVTQSLPLVFIAGAIFGLGYGAYLSVDWALVADVLPSRNHHARDMGVWNISLSLPQVIAPVLGGPLLDGFRNAGHPVLGFQLLFAMCIVYCIAGTFTVRYIKSVKA